MWSSWEKGCLFAGFGILLSFVIRIAWDLGRIREIGEEIVKYTRWRASGGDR